MCVRGRVRDRESERDSNGQAVDKASGLGRRGHHLANGREVAGASLPTVTDHPTLLIILMYVMFVSNEVGCVCLVSV